MKKLPTGWRLKATSQVLKSEEVGALIDEILISGLKINPEEKRGNSVAN